MPEGATQVKAIVEVVDGNTGFFDSSRLSVGGFLRYTIPSTIRELRRVRQQREESNETDRYREIPENGGPREMRRLKLEGIAPLSTMSSDTGTTEIGAPQIDLLIMRAQYHLWRQQALRSGIDNRKRYMDDADIAFADYESMLRPGFVTPPMGAQERRGVWHTDEDASGYYLIFERSAINRELLLL